MFDKLIDFDKYSLDHNQFSIEGEHESEDFRKKGGFVYWLKTFFAQNLVRSLLVFTILFIFTALGLVQAKRISMAFADILLLNWDNAAAIMFSMFVDEGDYRLTNSHPQYKEIEDNQGLKAGVIKGRFFYFGKNIALEKRLLTNRTANFECVEDFDCDQVAVGATRQDANDYCELTFGKGARLPTQQELILSSDRWNPFKRFRSYSSFAEHTSSVSKNDNDDYIIYLKKSGINIKSNPNYSKKIYLEKDGFYYVDEDDLLENKGVGFRCVIELNEY